MAGEICFLCDALPGQGWLVGKGRMEERVRGTHARSHAGKAHY